MNDTSSTTAQHFDLGIIEGFFGRPWSHEDRCAAADFLAGHGFGHYIYAPKADAQLRKRWREPCSADWLRTLSALRTRFADAGVAFGIGLSPYGLHQGYAATDRVALKAALTAIHGLSPDWLALLFDDMPDPDPSLAQLQCEIAADAMAWCPATRTLLCPTYYSDDPVLARQFGAVPEGYLRELGARLPVEVDIMWTGPRVCSTGYPEEHLRDVARRLGRKPFLWDNYPVNDGHRMSRFLHLRPVTGRPAQLRELTAGLAANPMNQAWLSRLPLLTLAQSLDPAGEYEPADALARAAGQATGDVTLARNLVADAEAFHGLGLDGLDHEARASARARYANRTDPFSREIVGWMDGEYVPDEDVLTQ